MRAAYERRAGFITEDIQDQLDSQLNQDLVEQHHSTIKVKEISREDNKSKIKESKDVSPTSKSVRYANQTAETLRKEPNSSEDVSPKRAIP